MTRQPPSEDFVLRKEPRTRTSIYHKLLACTAFTSSGLLGLGLIELFSPQTVTEWAKVTGFVIGGAAVSFGVNRLAVKSAAELSVKGFQVIGMAAVAGMLFVGATFAMATYAGLTLDATEALRLEQHGTALSQYAGDNARVVSPAARAVPIVRSIAVDLAAKTACERKESCISGRQNGGRGPVARLLEQSSERADTLAGQLEGALRTGHERAGLAGPLLASYGAVSVEPGSARAKRPELQRIDGQVRDAVAGRVISDPAALLAAYAAELESPVLIPGQSEATRALNTIFQTHAANLKRALSASSAKEASPPVFPAKAGVSDTLDYIGHFWPVAAIAVALDCIFPLLFWLCVVSTKSWRDYQISPARKAPAPDDELDLGSRVAPSHTAIHPAFDPEAYFPSLTPSNRGRLVHHELGGRDAD